MKFLRPVFLVVCFTLVFGLTACGTAMTPKDVLSEAAKKTKDLKSFTADMKAKIHMSKGGQTMDMDMDSTMKVQSEPMKAHGNVGVSAVGENLAMEMYMDGDNAYVKVRDIPQWIKVPNAAGLDLAQSSEDANPYESLNSLKKYADKIDLKETDEGYVLKVKSTDGKIDQFFKDYLQKAMPSGQSKELDEAFKNMDVDTLDFNLVVDKKTFYPKTLSVNLQASVKDADGSKIKMEENIDAVYRDFNKTEAIDVPASVKDGAVEVPADQLQGL
ncbi:MAG: DUF6612 family protein [Tuberibacillus sp.]